MFKLIGISGSKAESPKQVSPGWLKGIQNDRNETEDIIRMQKEHPLLNELWKIREVDLKAIDVPAFIVLIPPIPFPSIFRQSTLLLVTFLLPSTSLRFPIGPLFSPYLRNGFGGC